jgi:hypothetical protein
MPLVDRPSSSRRDIIDGLITAALVGIITLAIARHPQGPASGGLDSSWGSVLRYAHDHGLDFGTDVVFTYGPLGHAVAEVYSGGATQFSNWVRMVVTLFVVVPIVLVARQLSWQAGVALLLLVSTLPFMRICGLDGLVQAALCCWGLLAFTADAGGLRPTRSIVTICMAMAMCVALVGLAKFSWLLAGGATVCAVAVDLGLRGRPWLAAATIAATGALWLAGWAALGHPRLPRRSVAGRSGIREGHGHTRPRQFFCCGAAGHRGVRRRHRAPQPGGGSARPESPPDAPLAAHAMAPRHAVSRLETWGGPCGGR